MRKFKVLLTLLLLSIILLVFTACSEESEEVSDNSQGSDSNIEETDNTNVPDDSEGAEGDTSDELSGEVEFMTISLLPAFEDYLNGLKDSFEAEHPNVTVTINDVPYEQVEQIITTQAAGGQLPDVMNLNTDFVKKIAAMGALVNMDEEAADVKDTFFEGLWTSGLVNGAVYALPWYTSTGGLVYNPDLLEQAGYSEPPSTYEEAWEMSEVLYEELGVRGQIIGDEMHILFPKNGIDILNEDNTAAAFNTPEAVELWTSFKEYYDKGLYELDVMLGQVAMPELYAQEQVAWWGTGPALLRRVRDISPEVYEKSIAAPALKGTAGLQHNNPMNIAVSAKSESLDAAIEFAKFVTNGENQLAFAKEASVIPPVIEAAEDEYFTQHKDSEDAQERGLYYAVQELDTAVNMIPHHENIRDVFDAIEQAFQRVLLEDQDPAEALSKAENEINNILQE